MQRKQLTIGLFGFGTVGKGLHDVLERTPTLNAAIKTIVVKHPDKARTLPAERFSYDPTDILHDPDINVVVELIDDADAAFALVFAALKAGKAVVSANKKMLAEHLPTLLELQRTHGTALLYEGACCASIPIIRNLEEYFDNDCLNSIAGIVNGSTNYILTEAAANGLSFAEATAQAQALGYAESDPALDVNGYDARFKLTLLLAHAFGLVVRPEALFMQGIQHLGTLEARYAREKDLKVKLVAQAFRTGSANARGEQTVAAFVMPTFVARTANLHAVDGVFNGVLTQTAFADTQFFVGRGAGAYPTASAVLSDISALGYGYRYEYRKMGQGEVLQLAESVPLRVFVRHPAADAQALKVCFNEVEEVYGNATEGYIVGTLPTDRMARLIAQFEGRISFVLLPEGQLQPDAALVLHDVEAVELIG